LYDKDMLCPEYGDWELATGLLDKYVQGKFHCHSPALRAF